MTALFRSFVVWLMLLALPYQGYAAAQMQLCAVPSAQGAAVAAAMEMPSGPHDHAAMLAAQQLGSDKANHHTNLKCSGSACCSAAAPLLTLAIPSPLLPSAAAVPFYSDSLPAVDLAHPERPPQGRCA
ncbi:hypothetical protein GTP45_12895 [Pseudoduganella sp. FT55W]|uniref:DUF2946 domain-containing protein n=1 Tax=Duganella rivi TaxID=2666083 RepID=A0A7X4GQC3_9BURK|nr:hypothetical protein [Duganella rivi]MYM67725.1 hypothetical protein [Duganella rivi]